MLAWDWNVHVGQCHLLNNIDFCTNINTIIKCINILTLK